MAERPLWARWRSQVMNKTSASTPTVPTIGIMEIGAVVGQLNPRIFRPARGCHQPSEPPSIKAKTVPPNPITLSSNPSTSTPGEVILALVSGTYRKAPIIITIPIGKLTRKIQGQVKLVVSQPPSNGPTAAIPEMTAPQMPKATARSFPRKVALTVERVEGRIKAPPIPWTTRAAINEPASEAREASKLPPIKMTSPATNKRRRPNLSLSRPAVSSRAAKTTE